MSATRHLDYDDKRAGYYGHTRSDVAALVPPGVKRLLDVGCGEGAFGASLMIKRPELEVWGIEFVPASAAVAQTRLTRVICSTIENAVADLPDRHFDCITFNDVLEHLVDPWTVLKALRGKLDDNGVVVASIPNLRYLHVMKSLLLKGEFEYTADGVLDATHLRFFTKRSMQRLLRDTGYVVTRVDGLQWTPFPWFLSVLDRLLARSLEDMHYLQFALQAKPGPA